MRACLKTLGRNGGAAIIAILMFGRAADAATYYVVPTGDDGYSGGSWTQAFASINRAVSAAGADVVLITNGATYVLTNRIAVSSAVTIRSWKGPDGDTDRLGTIIDGNASFGCFDIQSAGVVLDGLTLTNGRAANGGGVYSIKACTITNCWIVGNSATSAGGGLYASAGLTVQNCWITANTASTSGGGYYMRSTTKLLACDISRNRGQSGGGLYAYDGNAQIRECTINANTATAEGGGLVLRANSPVLADSEIVSNVAGTLAGGLHTINTPVAARISNCLFQANQSTADHAGGVYLVGGSEMGHCRIVGNTAAYYGGGLVAGNTTVIRNCLVAGNRANSVRGAGMYLQDTASIESCTVVDNFMNSASTLVLGAGICMYSPDNAMTNCVVWSNRWGRTDTTYEHQRDIGVYVTATTNRIYYTSSSREIENGQGNIAQEPVFAGFAAGNYRLASGSPGLNAGTNQPWMFEEHAADLDGRRRIDRVFKQVDMGAFEYLPGASIVTIR